MPSKSPLEETLLNFSSIIQAQVNEAVQNIQLPPVQLPVYRGDTQVTTLPGYVNPQIHKIITVAEKAIPVCLFGGSGVGKTTLAEQVAQALDLPFYCQTVTAGMPESTLLGRQILNETGGMTYATTPFLQAVENGGVFLLDEFDAIDENCALAINNLLEFGKLDLPMRIDKPRLEAHPNFRFIACANTRLNGASLIHNGRNQLDGATISRFDGGIFEIDYDEQLEEMLCPSACIRVPFLAIREIVLENNLRKEISTRTLKRAEILWQTGAWKSPKELINHFLSNWSVNETTIVEQVMQEKYKAIAEEMADELMTSEERQERYEQEESLQRTKEVQASQIKDVESVLALDSDE